MPRIEAQIERFAPGFGDVVVARHTMGTAAFEDYNPNYLGGDITGGVTDWRQYHDQTGRLPAAVAHAGAQASTSAPPPPRLAGVHGLCGLAAARLALRDHP